jgi:hypothetical protein
MSYNDLLVQLQTDCAGRLNSEDAFQYINAVTFRKAIIAQEIQEQLPHLTTKNGKLGVGIVVMMPSVTGEDPNIATPQGDVLLPFHIVEQPEINLGDAGTGISAEQVALLVRAFFHQWSDRGQIILMQDAQAIQPLIGIEQAYPGCVGYQVLMRGRLADQNYPQCAAPTLSEGPALTITLSTTDSGAAIYFTVDRTFPGSGNPGTVLPGGRMVGAQLYAAPFTVIAGQTVAFASYKTGLRGSDIQQVTINS